MKRPLPITRLIPVFLISVFTLQIGYSQALLTENFDYDNGTILNTVGWTAHSGAGTESPDVVVPGLTFTGYPLSDIGGTANLDNNGEDVHKTFTTQTTGEVYVAFMAKVNAVSTAGYFLHLGLNPNSSFFGRVWMSLSNGNVKFGLSKTGTSPTYTDTEYTIGTTYLLVLKYKIIDGATNDEPSLYIIDGTIPETEPASPNIIAPDIATTDNNPGSIGLRQFNSTQGVMVDGIRIANSWTEAVTAALPVDTQAPVAVFVPSDAAVDVLIDVVPTITFDEAVLKTDASELVDADLATLLTFKKTDISGEDVPFSATIDATKKVITVTPSAVLDNSQSYYLAVGPVEDALGNESTGANVTFTTIAAATPIVAITAPAGGEKFYAGQDVTVTWTSANVTNIIVDVWVPGAGTWQSYIGTTDATLGTVGAVVPADAPYGTTYKLRVADADNPTTVFSESGEFTVIGVATSITDLRARFVAGDVVKLNADATVTMLRPNNRNQKYIQDAGAGLLIDDPNPGVLQTVVAVGDNINGLEGKLALYHGLMEIVPTAATVTVSSSGNTVTAPELTIPDYITNYLQYESMLIKFKKVNITQGDGTATFAASTNYTLSDGTNSVVMRTFYAGDGDVVGSVIPTAKMDITVIAGFYDATVQTFPLNMADMILLSSDKAITSFAFNALSPAVTGVINEEAKTITLAVPAGVDKTTLVPTIAISEKATVAPLGDIATDFTNPVTYTVTAEDGTTAVYTVTVRTKSALKAITAFSFGALSPVVNGTINETAKTITATVPAGTSRTALVPTITISEYATIDPLSGVARDFTSPVTYTVTAEDGTTASYTVTISVATGIEDNLAGRLKLFPVPATTQITARNIEDVILIEIFDITGNKRITERCEGEQEITIPVDQLARGIYFMKLTTLTGTHIKRFVKD